MEQRAQLAVYVNVFGLTADTTTVNIGDFPDREFSLDSTGIGPPRHPLLHGPGRNCPGLG